MSDPEPAGGPGPRRSVFGKLVAIMIAMAISLLLLVAVVFLLYIGPILNVSVDRVVHEYARVVAATGPDLDAAKRIAARLDVQIRYEGPRGTWATAPSLPAIRDVEHGGYRGFDERRYFIVPAPDGGAYLFGWAFTDRFRTVHRVILAGLLLLVAAIVFAAHAVIRYLLRPLRGLSDGVARLASGHLDTVVPRCSNDEFGALTDAFNGMVERVGAMIRTRDQLLLDVSHELRSPVTRLKVALELVDDANMKARMAGDLAEMEIMIGELIELERLRDGHGIKPVRQDIVAVLREVAANYCERPPGVRVTSSSSEIAVDVDGDRMRTVVRNLVENAIKYSTSDSRAVDLAATSNGEDVVIRVTDDGPGVPEADIPNLFEPFFRVDRSRSKKTGGYGLGLSIAKRIVEAHGGTIAVRNNPVRGASFVVTLPRTATHR